MKQVQHLEFTTMMLRRLVPTEAGRCKGRNHKYFFAINLYNSFGVILGLFASMLHVGTILGYENVFISVYENGSNNKTKSLLKISSALIQSVGMRIIIHTNHWCCGQFVHRIEYLAEVRNAALRPLI